MIGVVLLYAGLALGLVGAISVAQQRASWPPSRFRDLADPGYAKAVMNFLVIDEGDGWTRLVTETRVFATDGATARRFAVYWRLIYPGSSLIRRMWLAAIRKRAEGAPAPERTACEMTPAMDPSQQTLFFTHKEETSS